MCDTKCFCHAGSSERSLGHHSFKNTKSKASLQCQGESAFRQNLLFKIFFSYERNIQPYLEKSAVIPPPRASQVHLHSDSSSAFPMWRAYCCANIQDHLLVLRKHWPSDIFFLLSELHDLLLPTSTSLREYSSFNSSPSLR